MVNKHAFVSLDGVDELKGVTWDSDHKHVVIGAGACRA